MALPPSLAPLRLSPRAALSLVVVAGVVMLTLGSYGMTLSLLAALAFVLPALARGNTSRAVSALVLAGALPAALSLACSLLISWVVPEPGVALRGTMAVLGVGMGLPSLLGGVAFAALVWRAQRVVELPGLDTAERLLWLGAVAWCVAGDGHLVLMRLAHLQPPLGMSVLPMMTSALLLLVVWRRWRRGGALLRLAEGTGTPLWIIPRPAGVVEALPRLVSATDNRGLLIERDGAPFGEGAVVLAEAPLASSSLRVPLKGPVSLLLGHLLVYVLCGPR